MAEHHFCTYFDHRYLSRGIALHESLINTCPNFKLWVLALSPEAEHALAAANLPNLHVVSLPELERFDPELEASRAGRTLVEYYFTCSPCLPRYILAMNSEIKAITYLDSDLFFFSSPEPIFSELQGHSVGIVPHRFSQKAGNSHAKFGKYNVGWLTFVRSEAGLACLEWWRSQCIAWCFDRVEDDRYADQKYLEKFENLFSGVHPIMLPGVNVAPWNVASHSITYDRSKLMVDDSPLIFFHFQGLRKLSENFYDSNLSGYGARLSPILRNHVFRPYLFALKNAERFAATLIAWQKNETNIRRRTSGLMGFRYAIGTLARSGKAALLGNIIRA